MESVLGAPFLIAGRCPPLVERMYVSVCVCVCTREPWLTSSLCPATPPPGCSQAGCGCSHTDHRRLPERSRVQQEPCGPAAAGTELQGEALATGEPGLLQDTLIALEHVVPG